MIETRPLEAAEALEALPEEESAELLREAARDHAARVIERMVAPAAAAVLRRMAAAEAGAIVTHLPRPATAAILRRVPEPTRGALLAALRPEARASVEVQLAYPEGTAAAIMDVAVLVVPRDADVAAVRTRLHEHAAEAHYNIYVVARDGTLVGVLNLRELFMADPDRSIESVMQEPSYRIPAGADRLEVLAHPGWRHVHSLPVVDQAGRFLGAIRFRAMRELEERLVRAGSTALSTSRALGELYWAGASGLVDALVAAVAPASRRPAGGDHVRSDS